MASIAGYGSSGGGRFGDGVAACTGCGGANAIGVVRGRSMS